MAIRRTFNGSEISKPGAYSKIMVLNLTGFPLQPSGTVGIIGVADGGEPRVLDILSREGIQEAKVRYKSGPIAKSLDLLVNGSKDTRIVSGASKIVVYKVNSSTKASLNLQNSIASPVSQLKLESKNYGVDENNINALVSVGGLADSQAKITGTVDGPFTLAGSETLIVKVNGANYTFTNTLTGATSAADMVTELNTDGKWAPSRPLTASGTTKVSVEVRDSLGDAYKQDYGYVAVDASSTIDTILGITGSARGVKGSRVFTHTKGNIVEVTQDLGTDVLMSVIYTGSGTECALSIKDVAGVKKLTTDCTGASADNLDIDLTQYTVGQLVTFIDTNPNYTCTSTYYLTDRAADELDYYDSVKIKNVAMTLKGDIQSFVDTIDGFELCTATPYSNVYGTLAAYSTAKYLSGGTYGTHANSDWQAGFDAMKEERINIVVPLISEDTGSVTVDSINAQCANHILWGWSTNGKNERQGFISKKCSKAELKTAAKAIQSGYVSMIGQEFKELNESGELEWMSPWAGACLAASMQAGAEIGEPLTYKYLNANDIRVADGSWNPKINYAEMIEAGVMFAEAVDTGGYRWVVHNTTYGKDASFVWNRGSVVAASGYVSYDLRYNLEEEFTGTKAKTGSSEAIKNFIKARMTAYLESDIIVGDDSNEGLGYKKATLSVVIDGNTAKIRVEITPVQGIDFLLPEIYLSNIKQSA